MTVDKQSIKALRSLYKNPEGIPFEDLEITNQSFLMLVKAGYLHEPEGMIVNLKISEQSIKIIHKGNVKILPKGTALGEEVKASRRHIYIAIIGAIPVAYNYDCRLIKYSRLSLIAFKFFKAAIINKAHIIALDNNNIPST